MLYAPFGPQGSMSWRSETSSFGNLTWRKTTSLPFTLESYAFILREAKEAGYLISPLSEVTNNTNHLCLILRHDVDFSLDYALEMAEYENKLGARSTYYVLLHSDYYNPSSPPCRKQISKICELGHEIGLHWDSSVYADNLERLRENFLRDVDFLSFISKVAVVSAAQHIPTDNPALNVEAWIPHEAYSKKIWSRFRYVSDSSMQWRANTPLDLISEKKDIQFLSHPIWWVAPGSSREDKVRSFASRGRDALFSSCEEFIVYMNRCLQERDHLDNRFRERQFKK
jgi:hypothetical protein